MAVDHALFESVQNGAVPALRFYRWQPACLSLGRNQPARSQQNEIESLNVDLVRRPTGGMAVLHDCELTYSVVLPVTTLGSPRNAYVSINGALLSGLAKLGVPAQPAEADTTRVTFRNGGSCFAGTAPGEVGVAGRKLVGSAQRYEHRTILQHGSILLDGDQSVADLLGGTRDSARGATALRRVLGRVPEWAELVDAFRSGFEEHLGIALAPASLAFNELARARELTHHYATNEWTWRV